jgi:hypothetical protein
MGNLCLMTIHVAILRFKRATPKNLTKLNNLVYFKITLIANLLPHHNIPKIGILCCLHPVMTSINKKIIKSGRIKTH